MAIEDTIKRAYELYKKHNYSIAIMEHYSKSDKEEFDSYNITQEQINIWNDEYALKCINKIENFVNNKIFYGYDMEYELELAHGLIDIILYYSPKKENLTKIIETLELLDKKSYIVNIFDPYNRTTSYMMSLIFGVKNPETQEYKYYFEEEHGGLIPYLYKVGEFGLYDRALKIIAHVLKIKGVKLNNKLNFLMDFTKIKNDLKNYNLLKESFSFAKKFDVFVEQFYDYKTKSNDYNRWNNEESLLLKDNIKILDYVQNMPNFEKGYILYKEYGYGTKSMPYIIKQEFDKLMIPEEQIIIWNEEYANETYNAALKMLKNDKIDVNELLLLIDTFMQRFNHNKVNCKKIVDLLYVIKTSKFLTTLLTGESDLLDIFMHNIFCQNYSDKEKKVCYYGLIPLIHSLGEIELYNKTVLFFLEISDVLSFDYTLKILQMFFKEINDISNYKLAEEALARCNKIDKK